MQIRAEVLAEICKKLKQYPYETGGIIGTDERGVITAFQVDKIQKIAVYEYYPNTDFLTKVINEEWEKQKITFVGFVHSHLHNNEISNQDIAYCREIFAKNTGMSSLMLCILDLSQENEKIAFYEIREENIEKKNIEII